MVSQPVRRAVNLAAPFLVLGLIAHGPGWSVSAARADVVSIGADRDNTLYENATGSLSNGAGEYLFAGRIAEPQNNELRRALIRFDVAGAVPAGATINSVSLRLNMSRGISSGADISLHRALRDWGEAASDADGEEGGGAPAETGDATWIHAILGSSLWSAPGGDFDPVASAVKNVGQIGPYEWNSPSLAANVQAWLDQPSLNFGWAILGDEEGFPPTSKRFDSRQNLVAENRPLLTINFTPVPAPAAACLMLGAIGAGAARRRRS